jgi:signal transduction histidine kinase/DNA-binding response OmpR family regulator
MPRYRDLSLKTKVIVLVCVSSGLILALCCTGFVVNDVRTLRAAKVEEFRALAKMLAFNSTAVVSFHDEKAAEGLLSSLESQPAVNYACLLDGDGKPLASYVKGKAAAPDAPAPADEGHRFTPSGQLELWYPILDDGNVAGSLFLRSNMDELRAQLWHYAAIAAEVMLGAAIIAAAFAARLQRVITRPISTLAEAAKRISLEGDCSVRVSWDSGDELGGLYQAFNHMLERLQSSEAALRQAHDELEERVALRTAQLRAEIAEREQAQVELEHARDAAEAASRAKSEFLANMSHEIRTPLNAILGFANVLQRGMDRDDPATRQEYLDTIHASGEHLLTLINDILDLSKIEAGKLEIERVACSPDKLLAEVVSVLRVRAHEKGLTLDYEWATAIPQTIFSDPSRLRQLLMNLVGNAIKFTQRGGVHVVGRMSGAAGRPQLQINVIDTGVGIPADQQERIFNPFVQADSSVTRKFGGTGLGLAISGRIAKALGGRVTVQSKVGKGSTFAVTLDTGPLESVAMLEPSRADVRPAAPRKPAAAPAVMPHARVLVVEDGDANRKLISVVLRQAGLEVATAENGLLGLEAALRQSFDLILMDMQMPVMDGYTAATTLRQQGLAVPIIALTAHAMTGDEEKCRAAGCSGYMTKPIEIDTLLGTVAEALRDVSAGVQPDPVAPPPAAPPAATAPQAPRLVSTLPMDDPEFREIVAEFVAHLDKQLAAMEGAMQAQDMKQLAELAHWLKGAGGTVGFPAFTVPAKRLETLARQGPHDGIEQAVAELREIAGRIELPAAAAPSSECSLVSGND